MTTLLKKTPSAATLHVTACTVFHLFRGEGNHVWTIVYFKKNLLVTLSDWSIQILKREMDGMERVDENYELKMAAFEADCNDGQGEPVACHHVGEFYSVVKDEHNRSAKVYEKNCYGKNYGPSCFNLARLYRT